MHDTPWSNLAIGKTDTRRVSASAKWNWFWAVLPYNSVALVMKLSHCPASLELPALQNLDISFRTLSDGPIFCIRLRNGKHLELFETLCRDIVAAGELEETEEDALNIAIKRTYRWHYLLRSGKLDCLTEEEQKGLVGEIEFLKLLINSLGATEALQSWMGPTGAPKDFELAADCIEVKARRSASKPTVKITNEHQLADVSGHRLWLSVISVDRVSGYQGKTLTEIVNEVTALIESADPALVVGWEIKLSDAGYDAQHDYSAWRWAVSAPDFYFVGEGFPRITTPVSPGVTGVSYSLELSACSPFRSSWSSLHAMLTGGNSDE